MSKEEVIIISHRVNTLEKLMGTPSGCGVEIDIRGYGPEILLNHDPVIDPKACVSLDAFLSCLVSRGDIPLIVFNIKEAGYEDRVIELAVKHKIPENQYFLLDVEFPYLYKATRVCGMRQIAVRFSEAEPIENVKAQMRGSATLLDWVWIDTNTRLPVDENSIHALRNFKTCLVSPDRWGRPEDILNYADAMKSLSFRLDAVMTDERHIDTWKKILSA